MKQWIKKYWDFVAIWWLISVPYVFVFLVHILKWNDARAALGCLWIIGLALFYRWGKNLKKDVKHGKGTTV